MATVYHKAVVTGGILIVVKHTAQAWGPGGQRFRPLQKRDDLEFGLSQPDVVGDSISAWLTIPF